MKFFAVFAAIVAVAVARTSTSNWTLEDLSEALQNPYLNPTLKPVLEQALNEFMAALYAGEHLESYPVSMPADELLYPSLVAPSPAITSQWTLEDLSEAVQNPHINPVLKPILEQALNEFMAALFAGQYMESISVSMPANELLYPSPVAPSPAVTSQWTLEDLSEALQNPHINPVLKPILEQALNDFMDALFAGQHLESIGVSMPVGELFYPSPVAPSPVNPSPVVPSPVVPSPVAPSADSPLVQIIVNVQSQQQVADVVAPSPVIPEIQDLIPTPVLVVEGPQEVIVPTPVQVVEGPQEVIAPTPVQVVEGPQEVIVPEPVIVAPAPVNPVDVIAVNPVDSWGPAGLMPAIDTEDVGPL